MGEKFTKCSISLNWKKKKNSPALDPLLWSSTMCCRNCGWYQKLLCHGCHFWLHLDMNDCHSSKQNQKLKLKKIKIKIDNKQVHLDARISKALRILLLCDSMNVHFVINHWSRTNNPLVIYYHWWRINKGCATLWPCHLHCKICNFLWISAKR